MRGPFINDRKDVVVIGAGISGLCTAYWLQRRGIDVLILESSADVGGTMKTVKKNGWLIETGPNSALETTPLFQELFTNLGLNDQLVYANKATSTCYIVKHGKLLPLPTGLLSFITSPLWTSKAKFRLFREPFIGRARREESVAEFVQRRLGHEFLDYAVNPFVAGVYAGNPEQLSVQTAFPKLYALEEKYGGLMKGALRSRKERRQRKEIAKDRARLFSFKDGIYILPKSIAANLGDSVKCQCTVDHIIPMRAGRYPIYTISYTHDGNKHSLEATTVVLASPAHATAEIIRSIDPEMAKTLEAIYYPPVAEVFLGFTKSQIQRPLDGFGFLVPEKEHRRILGTIWSSSLFPQRAPDGFVALTSFVGGARQPELLSQNDEELIELVCKELHVLLNVNGKPVFSNIIRWKEAIPQYNLGYYKILQAMERFEENFRGAFICSNYRGGTAVGDCVMNANRTAERVSDFLKTSTVK